MVHTLDWVQPAVRNFMDEFENEDPDERYCAICGGPFRVVEYLGCAYDPDFISLEEMDWIHDMYIVGRHHTADSEGIPRCFLARGDYGDDLGSFVEVFAGPPETRDPNFPGPSTNDSFRLGPKIQGLDMESGWDYLSVHPVCLDLLCRHITGRPYSLETNQGILDKSALHFALWMFREHLAREPHRHASYRLAEVCQTSSAWEPKDGTPFLVANPSWPEPGFDVESDPVCARMREILTSVATSTTHNHMISSDTASKLSARVNSDPFRQLPVEPIFKISDLLGDPDLFAWCTASWPVHVALRADNRFWRRRITKISMPWLVELVPLLEGDNVLGGVDIRSCSVSSRDRPCLA